MVVADIDVANAGRVAQEIRDGGAEAPAIRVDVTSLGSVAAMIVKTVATFGRPDVRYAIAGIASKVAIVDKTGAALDRVLAVNLIDAKPSSKCRYRDYIDTA